MLKNIGRKDPRTIKKKQIPPTVQRTASSFDLERKPNVEFRIVDGEDRERGPYIHADIFLSPVRLFGYLVPLPIRIPCDLKLLSEARFGKIEMVGEIDRSPI